jgi:hypothetical protein
MKKTFWSSIADLWCGLIHPAPMWPVHGYYRCPACWRQYAVPWEARVEGSGPLRSDVFEMRSERIA